MCRLTMIYGKVSHLAHLLSLLTIPFSSGYPEVIGKALYLACYHFAALAWH